MKKWFCIVLMAFVISACNKKRDNRLEFDGITPDIKTGVVIIENNNLVEVYGANIKNGAFSIKERLDTPGYYMIHISNENKSDSIKPFEVYLESGRYSIKTIPGKLYKYPQINSVSILQNQLSTLYDKLNSSAEDEVDSLNKIVKKSDDLSTNAFHASINKLSAVNDKIIRNNASTLKQYVKQYPNNDISIHLMDNLHYGSDPDNFYAIFQSLPLTLRNSDRGKQIDSILRSLIK